MTTALENAKNLYMIGIRDGKPEEAVNAFTGDRYTQHSTGVADGREGFIAFFKPFLERNPVRDIRVVRGWQDGKYVFLQAYQSLNEGEYEYVTTDFFDSDEEGKIVEHWDVIAEFGGANPAGHTAVDGATEITELEHTDANKALVRRMLESCFFDGRDGSTLAEFVSKDCVLHGAGMSDGLAGFSTIAAAPRELNYQAIVLCVGQGNFVATLCKATRKGEPIVQVDVFRVHRGKIVEHWENAEPVPENDVNSGKF
ncbi:MAG: nuclear transport factor 2 family protein [Myxococcota bacterium]